MHINKEGINFKLEINKLFFYSYQTSTDFNNNSDHNGLKSHTNRRSVIIINSDSILRTSSQKLKKVESLLYEEYGDDGKIMNSFMMYNLNDVSNFFKVYLNTEVCHVRCDDDED